MPAPRSFPFRAARWVAVAIFLVILGVWLAWTFILTSPASRETGSDIAAWLGWADRGAILETGVTIESVEGLPEGFSGQSIALWWQAPDRLRISTVFDQETIEAGRAGDEVWVHLPGKSFAIIGDNQTPRFTADPSSVQPVEIPPLQVPGPDWKLRLLPALLSVKDTNAGRVISASRLARWLWEIPEFRLMTDAENTVFIKNADGKAVALRFDAFKWHEPNGAEISWAAPKNAKRVALSHLADCVRVMIDQLGAGTPSLPPATGHREVVAASGKGRLELHDGVRVVFLQGSPEEMGRQQAELLREEIHAVVDRIVYGVGVASSFAKGRWFFGEIEEAQSRIQPFIPDAYLREMDAMSAAAGLHRQEGRLANFFPELFHCSGFALHGKATVDGEIYHGRILDYIRGAGLEDNAVVMIYQPDDGNAWVNVSYAGFVGSVTAMNEKHLAIGEMGGRGEGNWDGKPMAQLIREVMERCDTIDEAVKLMRAGPRTCEYYYVISDAKSGRAVGIKATPDIFETVWSGESHPQLPHPVEDTVLMSADDRYEELVRRVKAGYGEFDAEAARDLMTRPVCMTSNIQSVLFAPGSLDFWVANADSENVASHTRYTRFNLRELLTEPQL